MYLLSGRQLDRRAHRAGAEGRGAGRPEPELPLERRPTRASNADAVATQLQSAERDTSSGPPPGFTYTHEKSVIIDGTQLWILTANGTYSGFTTNREFLVTDNDAADVAEAEAIFEADFVNTQVAHPQRQAAGLAGQHAEPGSIPADRQRHLDARFRGGGVLRHRHGRRVLQQPPRRGVTVRGVVAELGQAQLRHAVPDAAPGAASPSSSSTRRTCTPRRSWRTARAPTSARPTSARRRSATTASSAASSTDATAVKLGGHDGRRRHRQREPLLNGRRRSLWTPFR